MRISRSSGSAVTQSNGRAKKMTTRDRSLGYVSAARTYFPALMATKPSNCHIGLRDVDPETKRGFICTARALPDGLGLQEAAVRWSVRVLTTKV